jgi:hypothetical protein
MMKGWVIKNSKGEIAGGTAAHSTTFYRTEKGARMGKKSFIRNTIADEYLWDESLEYSHYVAWRQSISETARRWPYLNPPSPEEIAVVAEKARKMEEEWQIVEAEIGEKD